jgi:chorismate synthase
MASNSFGRLFRITTWGESHGKAIGVVIDGCPAGLELDISDINRELALRAPGKSRFTSPRKEPDQAEILSGVLKTTGAPISILIPNKDQDPSKYQPIKDLLRPGHANYTYLQKYGHFDYRGGGRASARETACRVAAGAVAKKLLSHHKIELTAYIKQIGTIEAVIPTLDLLELRQAARQDSLFCPIREASAAMQAAIEQARSEGDSLGGIVEFRSSPLPLGLGDPIYEKLDAKLSTALMSLPASKGFEIGSGFSAVGMKGSEHNDLFRQGEHRIETSTNHAGGVLGGISNGMELIGRVAFKPPSSIK